MAGNLAVDVIIRGKDELSKVVRDASKGTKAQLKNIQADMTAITAGGIAVGGAAIYAALKPTLAFEDALVTVKSIAPGTFGSIAADMVMVEDASRSWAKAHTDSAISFVQSSYQMLSAGLNTKQAIAATETAMAVARGTMGDAIPTAQLLATMYNTLGDKTADVKTEMTHLGDVLVATQAQYQIANMDALIQGMTYAIPTAVQFGMTVEQAAAAVGQLNTLGLQGSMAGTGFAAAMSKMNRASKLLRFDIARTSDGGVDFIGTIENIKAKFGDQLGLPKVQEQMRKAFGVNGLRAITLMVAEVDALKAGYQGVVGSSGAMAAAQRTIESSTSAQLTTIKNQMTDIAMSFGQEMLPEIQKAMPKISTAMNYVATNWDAVMTTVKAATSAFLVVALPSLLAKTATILMAHPAVAAVAAFAAGASVVAGEWEKSQKKRRNDYIASKGVDRGMIFEGAGGAERAMAALDAEQKRLIDKANAPPQIFTGDVAPTSGEVIAFTPEGAVVQGPGGKPVVVSGGEVAGFTEVGGSVRIEFANLPAGAKITEYKNTNPDVPLAIKGDTGRSRAGEGTL